MPHCEYSYYVTLLHCNQFHYGGTVLTGTPPWPPLRTVAEHIGEIWTYHAVVVDFDNLVTVKECP